MLSGRDSSRPDVDRSARSGASRSDELAHAGALDRRQGTCLSAPRELERIPVRHPSCGCASGDLGGCTGCGGAAGSAGGGATPGGLERAGVPARLDVSPGRPMRSAACHPRACRAPWHPEEGRCAVPRAGPEAWARWAMWGRASTASGHAPGTARALRLAQTHTVVCERCGDLVPLQKARTAARRAGRLSISPADGCYGCGKHGRKARRAERQGHMALAILAGSRVLLETPPSPAARVELWMLPRSSAEAHARRVLARYQPRRLGQWLTHACCCRAACLPPPSASSPP